MLAVSIVFLGLVGTLNAAEPCKTPPQWEAVAYDTDMRFGVARMIDLSYDGTNKRVRALGTTTNTRTKRIGEAILRYDEDKFYFIDRVTEKCLVTPAEGEFVPAGVPDNATFLGEYRFGNEGALKVNSFLRTYLATVHGYPVYRTWTGGFAVADCVPVSATILDTPPHPVDVLAFPVYSIGYTNVTGGIVDESVFTPPDYCSNSTDLNIEFHKRRFYYM